MGEAPAITQFLRLHAASVTPDPVQLRDRDNDLSNGIQTHEQAVDDFQRLSRADQQVLLGRLDPASRLGLQAAVLRARGQEHARRARLGYQNRTVRYRLETSAKLLFFRHLLRERIVSYDLGNRWRDRQLERAAGAMFRALGNNGERTVFQADLCSLARDPRVRAFLEDLHDALLCTLAAPEATAEELDLWKLTLAHTGQDEAEAVRWLAVLFQDLTPVEDGGLHVGLIEDGDFAALLGTSIELLRTVPGARLQTLPPGLPRTGRPLYHYYVPRLVAERMRGQGVSADLTFLAALLLTTEYEFAGLHMVSYNQLGQTGASHLPRLIGDLVDGLDEPMDRLWIPASELEANLADIYLGYRGALRGSGLSLTPMTFEQLTEELVRDPEGTLERIFAGVAAHRE